jgi:hypothetical protein
MFELLLQTFLAKNLVKSLLISTLDKVIYYIGTFLQGSTKPLFTSQNTLAYTGPDTNLRRWVPALHVVDEDLALEVDPDDASVVDVRGCTGSRWPHRVILKGLFTEKVTFF